MRPVGVAARGAREWVAPGLLAVAMGAVVPLLLVAAIKWGRHIPQDNLSVDYALGVAWSLLLTASILVWPISIRDRNAVLLLWVARCGVGLGAMLLFEAGYPDIDGYGYFGLAMRHGLDASQFSFGGGTHNTTQLTAAFMAVLGESYHAAKMMYAYLGLVAVYLLYRGAVLLLGRGDVRILLLVGLFPSLLFWSTTLGKDPVVLLGISMYVLGVIGWFVRRQRRYLALLVAGVLVAGFIRLWLVPILTLPLLLPLYLGLRPLGRVILLASAITTILVSRTMLLERFLIQTSADALASANLWSQAWAVGGSAQKLDVEFGSFTDILLFIPYGAFTALFRPLPGEIMNPFGLMAGLENLLLLGMLVVAVLRFRPRDLRHPIAQWALLLMLVWSAFYALISYQNLGTASRFRLQILPIMLGLFAYLCKPAALRGDDGMRAGGEPGS